MRMLRLGGLASVLFGCLSTAGAQAQPLVAEQIDPSNADRTILGGLDAVGGLGDWALQNGTVCAVLGDPSHESDIAETGGGIVDLGLCGREDDQFLLYLELLNGSLADPVRPGRVTAEVDAREARLITHARHGGLAVETRYTLDLETPRRLAIRTEVQREEEGETLRSLAMAVANVRSLSPFTVSLNGEGASHGFVHPAYRGRGLGGLAEATAVADLVVAVGAEELEPGIAYGQRHLSTRLLESDGRSVELPHFFVSDGLSTALTTFVRPFWIGDGSKVGSLQLLQSVLMNLRPGQRLVVEQELWVGSRADVASVTDLLWSEAPVLRGRVDDPRAVVHVDRAGGEPASQVRVARDGRFALRLPPGQYALRVEAPAGRRLEREVTQAAEGSDVGTLAVGAPARVRLARGQAMRLVFLGVDGTPDPDFHSDGRGWAILGENGAEPVIRAERDVHLAGIEADPTSVDIPPGRYRVLATRGPEYSVEETTLELAAGEEGTLALVPQPVLETPGWISSDFHIHAAASLDNPTAPERRVVSYVAQGAEVLISTEHDNVYDFGPVVRRLGLAGRLPSLVGLEVTSEVMSEVAPYSIGHANAFPVPRDPTAYRKGAVANEGRRWREVIADLRAAGGTRVIQLDHARFADRVLERRAFLSHMGPAAAPYDRSLPLTASPNSVLVERDPATGLRDLDIDAMELLNGPYMDSYLELREDWFSFLRQGERIMGTANSDAHFLSRPVASPRNYVQVEGDHATSFDPDEFVAAILAGRMYGTTGPLVSLALEEAGLGDTFRGARGTLRGTVRAAAWVPVSELRVFVSGRLVEVREIRAGEPFEVPLVFERDAFVTTEVHGEADATYQALLPRFEPFAFTNPIWVDADADGSWSAPGH